jgi:hypothetical protein
MLMSCPKVMFAIIHPFLKDEQSLSVGEFVDGS